MKNDEKKEDSSDSDKNAPALEYVGEENDVENRTNQSYKAFDSGVKTSEIELSGDLFEEFKTEVFKSRPNIEYFYKTLQSTTLYTYAKNHVRENRNKTIKKRKEELGSTMYEQVREVLGSAIAQSVVKQLRINDSVSTVQHFTPLSHPDSLNSILQNALPYFGGNTPGLQNIIILACSGISFNNTKFPRGHLFHSSRRDEVFTNQFTFFGHTVDALPVIYHRPYGPDDLKEIKNSLAALKRDNKIDDPILQRINTTIQSVYATPHALSAKDYIDQLTITNYWLFKRIAYSYKKSVPSLVYLSQEKIVLALLEDHHLNKNTTIFRFLFDSSYHTLIDKYFDGITGAFSKEKGLGTYLFWAIPKKSKYRTQLWRDGNKLITKDGSYSVTLTPEALHQAIIRKELIPSVMLTFCVLSLYYGLILGGGYEQTYYLTQIKKAFIQMLKEVKDHQSADACEDLVTQNLVIPRPQLAYLDGPKDMRIPATALDLLLYANPGKEIAQIIDASKKIAVSDIIERTLPSIFKEYCKDAKNAATLSKITERDVEKFTKLDSKIPSLGKL